MRVRLRLPLGLAGRASDGLPSRHPSLARPANSGHSAFHTRCSLHSASCQRACRVAQGDAEHLGRLCLRQSLVKTTNRRLLAHPRAMRRSARAVRSTGPASWIVPDIRFVKRLLRIVAALAVVIGADPFGAVVAPCQVDQLAAYLQRRQAPGSRAEFVGFTLRIAPTVGAGRFARRRRFPPSGEHAESPPTCGASGASAVRRSASTARRWPHRPVHGARQQLLHHRVLAVRVGHRHRRDLDGVKESSVTISDAWLARQSQIILADAPARSRFRLQRNIRASRQGART